MQKKVTLNASKILELRVKNMHLGKDSEERQYWLFTQDNTRVYVKDDESWGYYDEQVELEQLLKALNPKGINEKRLLESFNEAKDYFQLH